MAQQSVLTFNECLENSYQWTFYRTLTNPYAYNFFLARWFNGNYYSNFQGWSPALYVYTSSL